VIVGLDLDAAPIITSLTGPAAPVKAGTSASFSASWTDINEDDTFITTWDWGDGSPDTVNSPASSPDGVSHTYAAAGFYTVTFTVTDSTGLSDTDSLLVIVYDPAAGWVTGSGTYAGGGTFSLSAKYNPAGTAITGTTSFGVPGTSFVSTSTSWMVVTGTAGTYAGTGTLNGASGYSFLVSVTDGGSPGSKDRVRFQISDSDGDVVYDTQPGAPINAAPTTTPTSGNVVVH
jgi:PKD repeat protein